MALSVSKTNSERQIMLLFASFTTYSDIDRLREESPLSEDLEDCHDFCLIRTDRIGSRFIAFGQPLKTLIYIYIKLLNFMAAVMETRDAVADKGIPWC